MIKKKELFTIKPLKWEGNLAFPPTGGMYFVECFNGVWAWRFDKCQRCGQPEPWNPCRSLMDGQLAAQRHYENSQSENTP